MLIIAGYKQTGHYFVLLIDGKVRFAVSVPIGFPQEGFEPSMD